MNLLALATDAEMQELFRKGTPSKHEFGLLFASLVLVTLLVLIWAVFIRKRRDETSRRYSYRRSREKRSDPVEQAVPVTPRKKRRKKRHRRRRNPTLAETGGLPPVRVEPFAGDPP